MHHSPAYGILSTDDLITLGIIGRRGTTATIEWSEAARQKRENRTNQPAGAPTPTGALPRLRRIVHDHVEQHDRMEDDAQESIVKDVNRVFDHLGLIYHFFLDHFNRNSLDGKGKELRATVRFQVDERSRFTQALWHDNQLLIGEGDRRIFRTFAGDLSIIAHEFMHGLIEHSGGLSYHGQTGALHESIADVFACMIVQHDQKQQAHEADWLVGDNILMGGGDADTLALRSLKAPGTCKRGGLPADNQPYHMDGYVITTRDSGGVHINSGIPNHAFFLLATQLGGPAWEKAGKIWYNALEKNNNHLIRFTDWAELTIAEAEELFGSQSLEALLTRRSWQLVGVIP